jgi:hypothetical protein
MEIEVPRIHRNRPLNVYFNTLPNWVPCVTENKHSDLAVLLLQTKSPMWNHINNVSAFFSGYKKVILSSVYVFHEPQG